MFIKNKIIFLITAITLGCVECRQAPVSCMENPGFGRMLVFVGEKLDVKELDPEEGIIINNKFLAKYRILERVCGNYSKNTIEFIVYDHYGKPEFEKYETVMLYVVEDEGKYYHEKYQFDDLYKTNDGRWASPYNANNEYQDSLGSLIEPVKISFVNQVSFSIAGLKKREIKYRYPEPYYKITGNKAIAIYGNYVPELLQLKKNGVLRARGLFGITREPGIPDIKVAEIAKDLTIPRTDLNKMLTATKQLLQSIQLKEFDKIKRMSFDSVTCSICEGLSSPHFYNDVEPIDSFIVASVRDLPIEKLLERMQKGKYSTRAFKSDHSNRIQYKVEEGEEFVRYEIDLETLTKFGNSEHRLNHYFQFVRVNGKFKFYGIWSY